MRSDGLLAHTAEANFILYLLATKLTASTGSLTDPSNCPAELCTWVVSGVASWKLANVYLKVSGRLYLRKLAVSNHLIIDLSKLPPYSVRIWCVILSLELLVKLKLLSFDYRRKVACLPVSYRIYFWEYAEILLFCSTVTVPSSVYQKARNIPSYIFDFLYPHVQNALFLPSLYVRQKNTVYCISSACFHKAAI